MDPKIILLEGLISENALQFPCLACCLWMKTYRSTYRSKQQRDNSTKMAPANSLNSLIYTLYG